MSNILHLSDLHFCKKEQAQVWYNQLAEDLTKELNCNRVDALILSGDIANYSIPEEYDTARRFIDKLSKGFGLDSGRIVIVPGNHDLNWTISESAYKRRRKNKYSGSAEEDDVYFEGQYVWVKEEEEYKKRFAHFSNFYRDVIGKEYPSEYEHQYSVSFFAETNLLVLGLNSAWRLDHHYTSRADIHPIALSYALTLIRETPVYSRALKMAVWHHPLQSDSEDRIKDSGFMEQLAKAGFRFALHGHVHKAENNLFKYDQSVEGRQIDFIGAGTFGAREKELTPAYPWQYNMLRLGPKLLRVETRRREKKRGAWKPDARWVSKPGSDPAPFYDIKVRVWASTNGRGGSKRLDWGGATPVSSFYGREDELILTTEWITRDRCRLVGIWGVGGIGKTGLAKKLVLDTKRRFDFVIWRSLDNAPPVEEILEDLIQFLSEQREPVPPSPLSEKISSLLSYLASHRCLVVLDNFEAIFREGERAGYYRDGFEGYGELIKQLAGGSHKSCVVITSRETPKEFVINEDNRGWTRSHTLAGLGVDAVRDLLRSNQLKGNKAAWAKLVDRFSGNPQFLMIVAPHIKLMYGGNIEAFLKDEQPVPGEPRKLFDRHFSRLPELEQEIMYWLAIEREPISLDRLKDNIIHPLSKRVLSETLESLSDRFMIERRSEGFSLQNVIKEYLTDRFCDSIVDAITTRELTIFDRHPLIIALSKDYIRNSQLRLILKPIGDQLLERLGSLQAVRLLFDDVLQRLRAASTTQSGYAAGNTINLLSYLNIDLTGYDFSRLVVRHAYLQHVNLQDVDFSHSSLCRCSFLDMFSGIISITVSEDGKLLASGDANGDIRVWSSSDGQLHRAIKAHADWVRAVAFSPDGETLYSSSDDRTVRAWGSETGQCLRIFSGHNGRVRAINISPDGRILASGSDDLTIRWWNATTGVCFRVSEGHVDHIRSVVFSPDGITLATCGEDRNIFIWDVRTGDILNTFAEHEKGVCSLAFSKDGRYLASASEDMTVRLWHLQSGRCIQVFRGHTRFVWCVAFSPNSRTLASGGLDNTVKLWDVLTGECKDTLLGHSNWVRSVAFSRDGKHVFSGSDDRTIRLWDVQSGKDLRILHGFTSWIYCVAFSPDGKTLAFGSEDKAVKLWNTLDVKYRPPLIGHMDWIWSVAFSPDGQILASGSGDQTIRLWNVTENHPLRTLLGHTGQVRSVAFSPDGQILASGSDDRTIKLWEVSTGRLLHTLDGHSSQVWALKFSPDGQILASGSDDRTIKLWDSNTFQALRSFDNHERRILSMDFTSDGKFLASASEDQTVKIWDVGLGKLVFDLKGHKSFVQSAVFSNDDRRLASGAAATVREWDINTGQCLKTASLPTDRVRSLFPLEDGGFLTCGNQGGTLNVWHVGTGELLGTLRALRPYEGMNIKGVEGLTEAQRTSLRKLGAVEL